MDISNRDMKLRENKTGNGLETARFALSYSHSGDSGDAQRLGYELLSRLKGSLDVIMELNSNLFVNPGNPKTEIIQFYADFARKMDLNYRYTKIPSSGSTSFFGRLLNQENKQDAHQIIIRIPSSIWDMEGFTQYINTCGTRYYFAESTDAAVDIADEISRMTDLDKLDYFKMIVFDLSIMGSMGINSKTLGLNDIKKLLNLP